MPNYYEILHIDPSASQADIETAIDEQYQKWNQLVTHHDPKVAAQANQAKQTLQEIRATLLDPIRRKVYDDAIGVGDTIGGLGDPEAILQAMATPMGVPHSSNRVPPREESPRESMDAWICPKCSKANPIGTIYCASCATRLSANCPNCGSLSELNKKFCPKCGKDKNEAFTAKKDAFLVNLQKERAQLQQRKDNIEQGNFKDEPKLRSTSKEKTLPGNLVGLFITVGLALFLFYLGMTKDFGDGKILFFFLAGFFSFVTIVGIRSWLETSSQHKRDYKKTLDEVTLNLKAVNQKISDISPCTYGNDHDKLEGLLKPSKVSEDDLWEEYQQLYS